MLFDSWEGYDGHFHDGPASPYNLEIGYVDKEYHFTKRLAQGSRILYETQKAYAVDELGVSFYLPKKLVRMHIDDIDAPHRWRIWDGFDRRRMPLTHLRSLCRLCFPPALRAISASATHRRIRATHGNPMAKQSYSTTPTVTPEGRLTFPSLREPATKGQYASNKYETTILIPKTADMAKIKQALIDIAKVQWPQYAAQFTSLANLAHPIKDGDAPEHAAKGYGGHYVIKAKSKDKPAIFSVTRLPPTPAQQAANKPGSFAAYEGPIKSGDFARISVTAGTYQANLDSTNAEVWRNASRLVIDGRDDNGRPVLFRPAVTFFLNSVQFLREGPSMGGRVASADDFDDGTVPAVTAGADDFI